MGKSVIGNGSSANDGTGDTLRAAATKINSNFTEIYNLLGGEFSADSNGISQALSTKITFSDSATGLIRFEGTTANAHETTLQVVEPTGDNQIVLPNASGNVVLDSSTNTLTNKTLTSPTVNTPTINAPKISGLSGSGVLQDSSGNEVLELTKTASAVNHVNLTNNATNNNPKITAKGGDTNVGLELEAKGTGKIILNNSHVLKQETVNTGSNEALSLLLPFTQITKGTAGTYGIADGVVGQVKYVVNSGAGNAVITPDNFGPGSTLTLQQNETGTLIFDGTNWQILATYGGAVA
jgi:type 1 fimbria pilin